MFTTALTLSLVLVQGQLAIKDIKVGAGAKAEKGDTLAMLYKGALTNGTVFDQNADKTENKPPFAFQLGSGQVIKGWDQGLAGMKVGGKRRLTIPPDLGYGDQGTGGIPPKSTLVFDVELLRVDKAKATPKIEKKIVKPGMGPGAKKGDKLTFHYTGAYVNGVKFDSSYDRKNAQGKVAPITLTLGVSEVVPGFQDALMGMKAGEKSRVVIPFQLAYGENGHLRIPGRTALVFDLELVSVGK